MKEGPEDFRVLLIEILGIGGNRGGGSGIGEMEKWPQPASFSVTETRFIFFPFLLVSPAVIEEEEGGVMVEDGEDWIWIWLGSFFILGVKLF